MNSPVVFSIAFYVLAAAVIVSALGVVVLRNIVHAALALIATFFFVAWLYLMMNADLLWVAQLLIYAGAIPVLIVFAVMLTRRSMSDTSNADSRDVVPAALVASGLLGLLVVVLMTTAWRAGDFPNIPGTVGILGSELVNRYPVPFELVSVLLLVGLIGAVVLARRESSG